ncbi:hypothetical protein [Streptomyces marispadix]|uniref:Lipoprotein n=1 Tax=Streptomyces marispadix TaxID=2922868 RepID=A0ABS9T2I0_9ACTN|nr:hypothetical protein [Streptomyces marispadix]MCH6162731.1 hypothetical protein [Streptomyces marispadix]
MARRLLEGAGGPVPVAGFTGEQSMTGVCGGRSTRALFRAPLLTLVLLAGATGCADDDGDSDARKASPRTSKEAQSSESPGGKNGSSAPDGEKDGERGPDEGPGEDEGGKAAEKGTGGAADGKDLGACDDAKCEVELSAGDELHPRGSYGIDEFTVESVKGHVITWTALFSGGRVSMAANGAEVSSTSCTNGSCSGRLGKTKGKLRMNGVTVEFTSIDEDSAVAKLSPGK